MRRAALLALVLFAAMPARADTITDVVAAMEQFRAAYNTSDLKAWTGMCTGTAVITDGVAPFLFQGPNACARWWQAQLATNQKNGWSNTQFAVDKIVDFQSEGDNAYLTLLTKFTYTSNGSPGAVSGLWTLTFHQTKAGWRVMGWTWAG